MSTTDIEKKNLEAHVEICAVRYANLDIKLGNLEERMDKVESYLIEIKDTLAEGNSGQYKTLITIGTTILGALIAGAVSLIIALSK